MPKFSRSSLAAFVVLPIAAGIAAHVARADVAGPVGMAIPAPPSTGATAAREPGPRDTRLPVLPGTGPAGAGPDAETPLAALPYSPSLDLASMDRTADPCDDLYQYACGGWEKANPIPADQSGWSVYGKLANDNQRYLWGVLNDLNAPAKHATLSPSQQKIADHFGACMNEDAVERLGAHPLDERLAALAAVTDKKGLAPWIAQAQAADRSPGMLFTLGANQDFENSQSVIAFAGPGGLGLPDRDYYLKTDAKSVELRQKYVAHVAGMLELLGDSAPTADAEAQAVMRIETALARASLTRVAQRNPRNLLHKMPYGGLKKLAPHFDWDAYTATMGLNKASRPKIINVSEPAFYKAMDRELVSDSLADWQTYFRWHLVNDNAEYLSKAFVDADFAFYGKTLHGTERLKARWKRCVGLVDSQLGEALGQEFVARTFTPEMKTRTVEMTKGIEAAMAERLKALDWMGPQTKVRAMEKLHTIVNKVGYPDRWRDYSSVDIRPDDFFGDVARANVFETRRQLAKIGQPLDRTEWGMTPADGERLLRSADERHQLPGRGPDAAAVRPAARRRAELRQHRLDHRPRTDPRLRRRRPAVRRPGQPQELVDAEGQPSLRAAGPVHGRPVWKVRRGRRYPHQQ